MLSRSDLRRSPRQTAPASRRFGAAIRDVPLRSKAAFGLFSHTRYWRLHEADAALVHAPVPALRAALALDDKPVLGGLSDGGSGASGRGLETRTEEGLIRISHPSREPRRTARRAGRRAGILRRLRR